MSAVPCRWLFALITIVVATGALADSPAAKRTRAFSALPDWTGLWQTEAAATLLKTGRLQPPQLWGKPGSAPGPAGPSGRPPIDFPSTIKACEPGGFPAMMEPVVPDLLFEPLITPEQTVLVFSDGGVRHIYTDGRSHPQGDDLWPTAEGHSIGRWDGESLLIDTIARSAGPLGPLSDAVILSDKAHFTERLRRLDADTLRNDMTIRDPERLQKEWNVSIRYTRAKDVDRMMPVHCRENERNPLVEGRFIISPP